MKKNLIQLAIGQQVTLKDPNNSAVWDQLNFFWILFFIFMGTLNLYVAYHFDENVWVNFKLFGGFGLLLIFTLAQGAWLSRFIVHD